MASPAARLEVDGLVELRAALKKLEPAESLKELQRGLKEAADIVAKEAKTRAGAFSARVSTTIRPGTSGVKAYVAGGKKTISWYGWADFGSRTPVEGQPRSVGPWTHSGKGPKAGRFIYPAFADTRREVTEKVADALDVAFRRTGFR